jgi:hypothetical protein
MMQKRVGNLCVTASRAMSRWQQMRPTRIVTGRVGQGDSQERVQSERVRETGCDGRGGMAMCAATRATETGCEGRDPPHPSQDPTTPPEGDGMATTGSRSQICIEVRRRRRAQAQAKNQFGSQLSCRKLSLPATSSLDSPTLAGEAFDFAQNLCEARKDGLPIVNIRN